MTLQRGLAIGAACAAALTAYLTAQATTVDIPVGVIVATGGVSAVLSAANVVVSSPLALARAVLKSPQPTRTLDEARVQNDAP